VFLAKVLSLRMILSVEGLGITTFGTFFEQTNACVVGGFVFASVLHPVPFFLQRRTAVFSAICMTLLFG